MNLEESLASFGIRLINERLGEGGSAWVHRAAVGDAEAFGLAPDTPLAVKEYKPELLAQPGQLERARQEAMLGARVQHPHVVRIHALLPDADNPRFLVMEWVDGGPLSEWIKTHGATADWPRLRALAEGILLGLEALHRQNVRHRDLKPENVMLRADGSPVVMDVGVAEIVDGGREHTLHTTMGTFLGSMRYASPQYLLDSKYELPDDVYGLGAIFFELFTGARMFEGIERKPHLAVMVISEGVRVEGLREGVPTEVAVLLRQMLHRTREARPTLAEVGAALADPAGSAYLKTAAELQTAEEQGFRVIAVREHGRSILIDLAGKSLGSTIARMILVRRTQVRLPSAGRSVVAEEWLCDADFKLESNGVGHLVVSRRRWQKGTSALRGLAAMGFGERGEWVPDEPTLEVRVGDWAVQKGY